MEKCARSLCLVGILAFALPVLCQSQSCGTGSSLENATLASTLSTGSLAFSFNLYKLFQSQSNVFLSPFSLRVAMAMVAAGAQGPTLSQMTTALQLNGFQSQQQSEQAFSDLLGSFCPGGAFQLLTANRLYLQKAFPVLPAFLATLSRYFRAQSVNVDFGDSAVRTQINAWVANQTDGTIPELLAPGVNDASTLMVIVNAIYFRGSWALRFNASLTRNQTFAGSSGSDVQVAMMTLTALFNYTYSEALKSQVLQLNYTGNRLAMYVLLPGAKVTLSSLQEGLNAQTFSSIRKSLVARRVNVSLPKFSLRYEAEMNPYLQSLGMEDLFGSGADLSGMATGSGLFVSDVAHQAFVQVDEEGTTAAAATAVVLSKSLPPPPEVFLANRPFVFVIYDLLYDQILFIGHLTDPTSNFFNSFPFNCVAMFLINPGKQSSPEVRHCTWKTTARADTNFNPKYQPLFKT